MQLKIALPPTRQPVIVLPMVEIMHPQFAANLRWAMNRRGISVTDIARHLGITYEMARRYTLGTAKPRTKKLIELSDFLSISPASLEYGQLAPATAMDATPKNPALAGAAEASVAAFKNPALAGAAAASVAAFKNPALAGAAEASVAATKKPTLAGAAAATEEAVKFGAQGTAQSAVYMAQEPRVGYALYNQAGTEIGQRVKVARERTGKTQSEFALACGITQQALSKIEAGKTESPAADFVAKVSAQTGYSIEWLIKGNVSGINIAADIPDELKGLFQEIVVAYHNQQLSPALVASLRSLIKALPAQQQTITSAPEHNPSEQTQP